MIEQYGEKMRSLLLAALHCEELWLRSVAHESRDCIKSIRQFDEKWIQYLVVRQSLANNDSSIAVWTETESKTDFVFQNGEKQNVAAFELKGPFEIARVASSSAYFADIVNDFRKLSASRALAKAPRYAVLLPWGIDDGVVEGWLNEALLPEVQTYLPGTNGKPYVRTPFKLNPIETSGTTMLVTFFKVA